MSQLREGLDKYRVRLRLEEFTSVDCQELRQSLEIHLRKADDNGVVLEVSTIDK